MRGTIRVLGVVPLLLSAVVHAQALGLKVGDGRLHFSLDAQSKFDSAAGFFNTDAAGKPTASPDLIFDFRPGIKFELDTKATAASLGAFIEPILYTGISSPLTANLNRLQAGAQLQTAFNRDGAVEIQLNDTFARSDKPQNAAVGIGVLSYYNVAQLAVPIHPGGRALEFTPRFSWNVEAFEAFPASSGTIPGCAATDITCNPGLVGQMNYTTLSGGLAARWKFFPKTALAADIAVDSRLYFTPSPQNQGTNVFKASLGVLGLITARISVTLMLGVSQGFASASNPTSPSGQVEVSYIPTDYTTVAIGYIRNVMPVPVYNLMADDRGYITGNIGFMDGRLKLAAQFAIDYFSFFGVPASATNPTGVPGRNDLAIGASFSPSFQIFPWFGIAAGYNLAFRTSTSTSASVNLTRHEAFLTLSLRY